MTLTERYEKHAEKLRESQVEQGHHAAEYACDLERIILQIWDKVKGGRINGYDITEIQGMLRDAVEGIEDSILMYEEEAEDDE